MSQKETESQKFIAEKLVVTDKQDGTKIANLTSADSIKYLKEYAGLDEKSIKAFFTGTSQLINDQIAVGGTLFDKDTAVVKVTAPITKSYRQTATLKANVANRNPKTGESIHSGSVSVKAVIRNQMDRELAEEVEKAIFKK